MPVPPPVQFPSNALAQAKVRAETARKVADDAKANRILKPPTVKRLENDAVAAEGRYQDLVAKLGSSLM